MIVMRRPKDLPDDAFSIRWDESMGCYRVKRARHLHEVAAGMDITNARCACCGHPFDPRGEDDSWEGRMDAYCATCSLTRCDWRPGGCGNHAPTSTDKEAPLGSGTDQALRRLLAEDGIDVESAREWLQDALSCLEEPLDGCSVGNAANQTAKALVALGNRTAWEAEA